MDPRFPPPAPSICFGGGGAGGHHRRAHSETFIRLPDADLLLDPDADFGFSDIDFPSLSDDSPAASDPTPQPQPQAPPPQQPLPQQKAASPASAAPPRPPSGAHMRSLSLDAAFFDGLSLQGGGVAGHKRSGSMDGATSPFEGESAPSSMLPGYAKKAVPNDKLTELALLDPKYAKR